MTDAPEVWWSPSLAERGGWSGMRSGLISRDGEVIRRGWATGVRLSELPADAVQLVPAEPVDEKGRGERYWRGFADGRMAERAGAPSLSVRDEVVAIVPVVEHLVKSGWVLGSLGRPGHTGADLGEIVKLVIESVDALRADRSTPTAASDEPPFAPELADAPIVTGESGAPAPLVVDHPVHESTLPAELSPGRYQYGGGANGLTLCDCGHPGVGHGAPESADGRGLAPDPCRLCGCLMFRARTGERP